MAVVERVQGSGFRVQGCPVLKWVVTPCMTTTVGIDGVHGKGSDIVSIDGVREAVHVVGSSACI